MSDLQKIEKITLVNKRNGHQGKLTLHYREGFEPSEMTVTIEDVENGHASFLPALENETFTIRNNVKLINLSANNLKRVFDWYSANSAGQVPLTTQKT